MEETNGINIAIKVLGEKIEQLESDLRYERILKENAEKKVESLEAENAKMASELADVQRYIEKMEV